MNLTIFKKKTEAKKKKIFNLDLTCETPGSAGFDIPSAEDVVIHPGQVKLVHTGLYFEDGIPNSMYMAIHSRSGLALKKHVSVANAPATVDADYKGEICVILQNFGKTHFEIKKGDRIAQGLILRHHTHDFVETADKERGEGGFGSTGV